MTLTSDKPQPCNWNGFRNNLTEALRRGELLREIRYLRREIPKLAATASAAAGAYQTALAAGAGAAITAAFGATSGGSVLFGSAGARAAVVGWSGVAVAGGVGVGAGLLVNMAPNPFTGESIGKGVQDTFTYLFFSKGW